MKPLLTTLVLSFFILPLFAFAQNPNTLVPVSPEGVIISPKDGLVSCEGSFCSACDIVVLANTGIKWLLTLSFLFFAILALRAGVKLVTSQGNSGALQDAKQSFTNAFIGLIIILVAWIFVDTLLRQLLDGGTGDVNGYGPWSKVQCAEQRKSTVEAGLFESDIMYEPPSYYTESEVEPASGVPSGTIQQKINSATLAYKGKSTATGPGGGNVACAWAVNNILKNAGIRSIGGNSVIQMERELVQGRGKRIAQSDAVAGDLVLLLQGKTKSGKVGNHVGVCLNNGCSSVLSNSSSKATFTWQSGPTFSPSYTGGSVRIYRVTAI